MMSQYCIGLLIVCLCVSVIYGKRQAQMNPIPSTVVDAFNFDEDANIYDPYQKRSTTEMTESEAQRDIRSPLGTMRFGKRSSPLGTMRFGKRSSPLGVMRFGKRNSPLGTMRFGKRDLSSAEYERSPLGTMRFGKRSAFVEYQ